jgi:hypothetical protein
MIRRTLVGGPVAVLLVLLAGAAAMAASSGECVTAHVNVPFRLPDGLLYPAGTLTLCDGGAFSPVNNLHKILVAGSSIGMFVSKKRNAELRSMDAPEVVFHRDVDGNLTLVGYTMPSSGRGVAYRLRPQVDLWQARSQPEPGAIAASPVAAIVSAAGGR